MFYHFSSQKGFAALFITVIILAIIFALAMPLVILVLGQQRIVNNLTRSNQAYFAAEAGIEDALLRLKNSMNWNSSYSLFTENSTVEIIISDVVAGARTITATADTNSHFRKVQVAYELSGLMPGLIYGAQVGDGGLVMEGISSVIGNVFSNGNAELKDPQSEVSNTIIVAGAGNKIFGKGKVKEDAYADICSGATAGQKVDITGKLHSNTITNCSYGSLETPMIPVDPIPLPITDSEIEEFKVTAAAGGTIGSYSRNSGTHYLGPVKIEGDLAISNTAQLIITGTIWVTGQITINNSARVRLDPSYGSTSGVIVGNNLITLDNSSVSSGSGSAGSYLMYVSTSLANPAIAIQQTAQVDILYSNTGWVSIGNNCSMRSVNAYGINVKNNSGLVYEIGLANALFTAGPGAGWTVTSWREIE